MQRRASAAVSQQGPAPSWPSFDLWSESSSGDQGDNAAARADGDFNAAPGPGALSPKPLRDEAEMQSARNAELHMMHTAELELDQGDTLVFVDLPSTLVDPSRHADCDGIPYHSQRLRVHSASLLATGSAKFAEMLRPAHQAGIQRRRKMAGKLPDGVEYVVDLTPRSEGDELAYEVTELSLTPAIMKWWSSHTLHGVDASLVTGHDDVCTCRRQPARSLGLNPGEVVRDEATVPENGQPTAPTPNELLRIKAGGLSSSIYRTPAFRQIADYCPVRHRNSIIRLLFMMAGRHVSLDSANRVWTLVALAKMLDCVSVLRDRVVQWMMHGSNTRFIEVLPEEALRIGFALQSPQLTQCAFRILVNELALKLAATDEAQRQPAPTTVFGRRLGECGDELNNVIQHAARAFVERVSLTEAQLQSPRLFDDWNIGEWSKLRRLEFLLATSEGVASRRALAKLRHLMASLPCAVASQFHEAAREHVRDRHSMLVSMDMDRATYVLPEDFEKLGNIMSRMNLTQRLLCPFIYEDLGDRCSLPLYLGMRLAEQPAGQLRYRVLLDEVERSLRGIDLDRAATAARADEWAEFLEPAEANKGGTVRSPLMDLERLDCEVKEAVRPLTLSWIRHDVDPPLNMTRHMLLTLTMNETKFLPLWAGGCDDGTGGVFESFVPPTDMGPSGPGPAYRTGKTLPPASASVSEAMAEAVSRLRVASGTTAASADGHDSISTVHRRDRAVQADDASMASESFMASGADYQEAKCAVPAADLADGEWDSDGDWQRPAADSDSAAADDFELEGEAFGGVSDSEDSVVLV